MEVRTIDLRADLLGPSSSSRRRPKRRVPTLT
jgi:hypothetical protein